MLATGQFEDVVETAIDAVRKAADWRSVLDSLGDPIYVTDADGIVTYSNPACTEFAGRKPNVGRDRWCVTWKMCTTTGEDLPHDRCPMADAIKRQKPVRGSVAIALRPDGSRRAFNAFPTPIFDDNGNLVGAVNLMIDVTVEQGAELIEQARRCRRLSKATDDTRASEILADMADGYEATASALLGEG